VSPLLPPGGSGVGLCLPGRGDDPICIPISEGGPGVRGQRPRDKADGFTSGHRCFTRCTLPDQGRRDSRSRERAVHPAYIPRGTATEHQIRRYLSGVQNCPDQSATWHDPRPPVRISSLAVVSRSHGWLPRWLPETACARRSWKRDLTSRAVVKSCANDQHLAWPTCGIVVIRRSSAGPAGGLVPSKERRASAD
jgi:hypothetical protein